MTNEQRAARLAQIFGWPVTQCPSGCVNVAAPFGNQDLYYLLEPDSGLLPWLLRELPKHKLFPTLDRYFGSMDLMGIEWGATLFDVGANPKGHAKNSDPLIALVDAVLNCHEESKGKVQE